MNGVMQAIQRYYRNLNEKAQNFRKYQQHYKSSSCLYGNEKTAEPLFFKGHWPDPLVPVISNSFAKLLIPTAQ